ncbi:hypothetical protein [Clostridium senegalense]|uniref:hypothetical protein n=1 Tax=Clostridium senegalense TaxID=1465809 RepID=UPI0002887114|nr:hypothetical protein [Clostridium senegalense]
MENNLNTMEALKTLYYNPTYIAINEYGHTLELKGDEKFIIQRKIKSSKQENISLKDNWRIIKPISYDDANELFKRLRTVECRFKDGSKRLYNKLPADGQFIIESDLPYCDDCLWYYYGTMVIINKE